MRICAATRVSEYSVNGPLILRNAEKCTRLVLADTNGPRDALEASVFRFVTVNYLFVVLD